MQDKNELKERLFRVGSGSLTSRQIAFNLSQNDKDPEYWQRGTRTRDFELVRWVRPEDAQEVIDEVKKEFPNLQRNLEMTPARDYANYILEITNWFKKWFGE